MRKNVFSEAGPVGQDGVPAGPEAGPAAGWWAQWLLRLSTNFIQGK